MGEEKKRARDILNSNLKIFKELIEYTVSNNGITINDFIIICNRNG